MNTKKTRKPYKIQDVLDILPDGNVKVCAVKQNTNKYIYILSIIIHIHSLLST